MRRDFPVHPVKKFRFDPCKLTPLSSTSWCKQLDLKITITYKYWYLLTILNIILLCQKKLIRGYTSPLRPDFACKMLLDKMNVSNLKVNKSLCAKDQSNYLITFSIDSIIPSVYLEQQHLLGIRFSELWILRRGCTSAPWRVWSLETGLALHGKRWWQYRTSKWIDHISAVTSNSAPGTL